MGDGLRAGLFEGDEGPGDAFVAEDDPVVEDTGLEHPLGELLKFVEVAQQSLHQAVIHELGAVLRVLLEEAEQFSQFGLLEGETDEAEAQLLLVESRHQLHVLGEEFKQEIGDLGVQVSDDDLDELEVESHVLLLLLHPPDLLQSRHFAGLHGVVDSEGPGLDLSEHCAGESLQFLELLGFDEAAGQFGVEGSFEAHADLAGVVPNEAEHILVDQPELLPSASQTLHGLDAQLDLIGLDELPDLDEGVADLMLLADLADGVDHAVGEGVFEVDHVSQDLLKLVPVVRPNLVCQQLLVERVLEGVVVEGVRQELLVAFGAGAHH